MLKKHLLLFLALLLTATAAYSQDNPEKEFELLKKISEKDSSVIIDHLIQRITLLSAILAKTNNLRKLSYNLYIYKWAMYKILLNNI